MYGLVNMSLILLLINYLAGLIAVQMLRGAFVDEDGVVMNFGQARILSFSVPSVSVLRCGSQAFNAFLAIPTCWGWSDGGGDMV